MTRVSSIRVGWLVAAVCLAGALGGFAGRAHAEALAPLSKEVRAKLDALPGETLPKTGRHYFRSNEWRQDLLVSHLSGLGGVYVGVGSDQNYTAAALARSELLFMMDFDSRMPLVHAIYGALISVADTADALILSFDPMAAEKSEARIRQYLEGAPHAEAAVLHYRKHRAEWFAYLKRVKKGVLPGDESVSWLSRPDLYDHVRQLHLAGRVIARPGDLTGETTLRSFGKLAGELGWKVRVLYMSNAEQFFGYTDGFIANLHALPIDDKSVALRTESTRLIKKAPLCAWHYIVHNMQDFRERLDSGAYPRSRTLNADLVQAGPPSHGSEGVSTITRDTPRVMLAQAQQRREARAGKPSAAPTASRGAPTAPGAQSAAR